MSFSILPSLPEVLRRKDFRNIYFLQLTKVTSYQISGNIRIYRRIIARNPYFSGVIIHIWLEISKS